MCAFDLTPDRFQFLDGAAAGSSPVCKRELEIRNFVPLAYFEVVATANKNCQQT